jgi:slit protein 2
MNPIALPLSSDQRQSDYKIKQNIACQINDCTNGGLCYRTLIDGKLENESKCKCQLGYTGAKCETLETVGFQYEDSYLEFESPDLEYALNLSLSIMTEAEYGILLYHGSKAKQHMAVELFKGRLRISYDVGNSPVSTMFSYAKINDGKERSLQFLISGQNITMKIVEDSEERLVINQGTFQFLNVGDEPLYIGGVPNSIKDRISKQLLHVRNSTSFKGCLSKVYVNSQLRSLQQVEYSHKVSPGCLYKEACYEEQNLGKKKCQNGGVCKPLFSLNSDHVCECSKEFMGSLCETSVRENSNLHHRAVPLLSNYSYN